MARELMHSGDLKAIFPVLVGELKLDAELGEVYGDFFKGGGMPSCCDEVCKAVEDKLVEHLKRLGKGAPELPGSERTVAATLKGITAYQGGFLKGLRADAEEKVVAEIVRQCKSGTLASK